MGAALAGNICGWGGIGVVGWWRDDRNCVTRLWVKGF